MKPCFSFSRHAGIIRTQELLDHETKAHYWLTVYASDRGVVPLSAFVEVYVEVQDVNDNAPQTAEPVYYPSVMENSPKDVSIIQIEAVDPDAKASDRLSYKITSGNPQGFFGINGRTGTTAVAAAAGTHGSLIGLRRATQRLTLLMQTALCCFTRQSKSIIMRRFLKGFFITKATHSLPKR